MLVSHRKRFIYLKTVKTASTSVESFFEPYCMPEGTWQFEKFRNETISLDGIVGYRGVKQRRWFGMRRRKWFDHMSATLVKKQLKPAQWNNYFKFCVIRNPFDRIVSAFHFFQWMDERELQKMHVPSCGNDIERIREWVKVDVGPKTQVFDRCCYTIDNQICVDFFIRYENLINDLAVVCDRLKIEADPSSLKNMVSGMRPRATPIADYYDASTKLLIERLFEFEFQHFGYEFPR